MRYRVLPLLFLLGVIWVVARVPFLATSLLVLTDSLAHAFRWAGVTDPGVAWLLLGALAGAFVGALVGMWRAGRPVPGRVVRGTATVAAAGMLVAGSYPPSGVAAGWGRLTRAGSAASPPYRVATPRPRPTVRSRRPAPAVAPQQTYSAGGEVETASPPPAAVAPSEPAAEASVRATTQTPAPDSAPPPAVPAVPDAAADGAVVADVRAQLAAARAAASAGDYAAALRALAAADESVTLAAGKYGEPAWVAALRRDAAGTRAAVRSTCDGAVATAVRRGVAPPLCE